MSHTSARTFSSDFRQFFIRGLAVLLPTVLTLWIVVKAYQFVDKSIAEPINKGVRVATVHAARVWEPLGTFEPFQPTPAEIEAERLKRGISGTAGTGAVINDLRGQRIAAWWQDRWYLDLIGIMVALIIVYITGRLVGGFLGRRIYRRVERLITSVPVFKQVYPYVKQIVDFLFSDERPIKFNRVVAVEYPRKGVWSVGFLTGPTMRSIEDRSGESVTIFIPSSPTPFTGYTVTVPRNEVVDLPITVEEAIRFSVSGGVLVPDHQQVPGARAAEIGASNVGLIPIAGPNEKGDEPKETPSRTTRDAG